MNKKLITVTKSSMPIFDEYIDEIRPLWENRWLSNRGMIHKRFENELSKRINMSNVSLFANGHVALEVTINAFHFPTNSEVITTPFTHCSTVHSIVRNGLKPVFCDINLEDYTIDVRLIESLINNKTVAIIPTHVYGNVCDVEEIQRIADKYHLKVIYDAAHAFGEDYMGKSIAHYGDASMYSFHATKVFHTIEGGMTVFKDKTIYDEIESFINFGYDGPEEVKYISTNARMNEFEAAMGLCNLRHFDDEILKRKVCYETYNQLLKSQKGIILPKIQDNLMPNYSYYPVIFNNYKKDRNRVQEELAVENIFARKYFYPIVPNLKCYKDEYDGSIYKNALWASENVLALPMYSDLEKNEIERICSIIIK